MVGLWSILVIWASQAWVPDDRHPVGEERYDALGALLVAVSLIALIYGASSLYTVPAAPVVTGAGVLGLALFAFHEFRAPYPLLNVRVLATNTAFAFSNLAALINYSATFSISYLLSLYLQVVRGYGAQAAGTLLLIQPLVMALLSPMAGRLSDRLQPRLVSSAGMAVTTVGCLYLPPFRGRRTSDHRRHTGPAGDGFFPVCQPQHQCGDEFGKSQGLWNCLFDPGNNAAGRTGLKHGDCVLYICRQPGASQDCPGGGSATDHQYQPGVSGFCSPVLHRHFLFPGPRKRFSGRKRTRLIPCEVLC